MRKKTKNIKVRDLKPKKDAKGGAPKNPTWIFNQGTHQGTNQGTNQGTHQGTQSQG